MISWRAAVIACLATAATAACSGPTDRSPRVVRVIITPTALQLPVGASYRLLVGAEMESGDIRTDLPVQWASRSSGIASVSYDGTVAGSGAGSTWIVATVKEKSDSILVTVWNPNSAPPSTQYYAWPDTSSMPVGLTRQLQVKQYDYTSGVTTLAGATWSSSDTAIAMVDTSGIVTAKAEGHATITATVTGKVLAAEVFVYVFPATLRFAQVSLGYQHACGVTTTGEGYCWGMNGNGSLATTGILDRCESVNQDIHLHWIRSAGRCSAVPRRVSAPEPLREIHARSQGGCALGISGQAYCWGYFSFELTLGGVTALPGAQFATMTRLCGLTPAGTAYCWGEDTNGDRGDGPGRTKGLVATQVAGGKTWTAISGISSSACALDAAGMPYCWGLAPVTGTAGTTSTTCYVGCTESPTQVAVDAAYASVRFTRIAATGGHNCAIATDGKLYCWGGDDAAHALSLRRAVNQPVESFASIGLGVDYGSAQTALICGVVASGAAYCDQYSRVAPADSAFSVRPLQVGVPLKFIVARSDAGCGIGKDDLLYCWGANPISGTGALLGTITAQSPGRVFGQ